LAAVITQADFNWAEGIPHQTRLVAQGSEVFATQEILEEAWQLD
jgi:hypothetical protein